MSSFKRETKHPKTGEWENAYWIDDLFGNHHYGVIFPSDESKNSSNGFEPEDRQMKRIAYNPEEVDLETRDS